MVVGLMKVDSRPLGRLVADFFLFLKILSPDRGQIFAREQRYSQTTCSEETYLLCDVKLVVEQKS